MADARTSQIARFRLITGAARERITKLTGAQMKRLCIVMLVCEIAGCAGPAPAVLNAYSGPERADSEIAVIRSVGAAVTMIDGRSIPTHPDPKNFYYRDFHVLPGEHEFRVHRVWLASIYVAPSGFIDASRDFTLKVEAGHTYQVLADRTTGHGYRLYFWVEDAAVKAVVAGEKP